MTDEQNYKIHNRIANLIVGLMIMLGGAYPYLFYMTTFHGNGWIWYENIPFPTCKSEYRPNEVIGYYAEYGQKKDAEKTVSRTIKSACGDSYDFPPVYFSNAGEIGIWAWWERTTAVPDWFKPCDRAWIKGSTTYKSSHWREITIYFTTQEFAIIK